MEWRCSSRPWSSVGSTPTPISGMRSNSSANSGESNSSAEQSTADSQWLPQEQPCTQSAQWYWIQPQSLTAWNAAYWYNASWPYHMNASWPSDWHAQNQMHTFRVQPQMQAPMTQFPRVESQDTLPMEYARTDTMASWPAEPSSQSTTSPPSPLISPIECRNDDAVENEYLDQIIKGCQRGEWAASWEHFLEFREKWLIFQQRFKDRGISFSKFNRKYQRAFKALRDSAEKLCRNRQETIPRVERKWISTLPALGDTLRVLTFNILSDYLSEQFSFQFVILDDPDNGEEAGDFLSWKRREPRIAEEIRRWDPDIVLLQEVDMNVFGSLVQAIGLTAAGPCIQRHAAAQDGICILYKESEKLTMKDAPRGFDLIGGGQGMVCSFTCADGEPLEVVNCHVQGMAPALDIVRARQLHDAATASRRIISGDFNGWMPESVEVWESLNSAYEHPEAMASGQTDVITCHNDAYHSCGELDYILTSGQVCGFAQIQEEERLGPVQLKIHPKRSLPNPSWPSDHVSLVCDIDFSTLGAKQDLEATSVATPVITTPTAPFTKRERRRRPWAKKPSPKKLGSPGSDVYNSMLTRKMRDREYDEFKYHLVETKAADPNKA